MQLDPRQTLAVRTVLDTGSFEQAALDLHLTASAISQRVRALETQLGGPLVVRTRPCHATPLGQRLMQYLRRAALIEDDFAAELIGEAGAPLSIGIAVNGDTLATWFLPTLSDILVRENVLLELSVDDQDHTHALMASGQVTGCVTTHAQPMRGCFAQQLGVMRYRLMASSGFAERWFPKGITRAAARLAPVVASTRRDALHARVLEQRFGLAPDAYPCHYLPIPAARQLPIRHGLGYGMVPELALQQGAPALVDLLPERPTDVALFWHAWKVQSPRLEQLSARIVELAAAALALNGPKITKTKA